MIDAIVVSLDTENTLVMPNGGTALEDLVGKPVRYLDKSDRSWPGKATGVIEGMLAVKFDPMPTGLGQGQIVQILDGPEDGA